MRKGVEVINQEGSGHEMYGVQDRPNYKRDPYSKAIFVVDEKALKEYQEKKIERERLTSLEDSIKDLQETVSSLINILKKD